MCNVINFKNLDSLSDLSLDVSRNMTFVYGGNGSGKTTLSRQADNDLFLVFNQDFINSNVYVTESEGSKADKFNKENFSSLFLGETAVEMIRRKEKTLKLNKEIKKEKENFVKEIEKDIAQYKKINVDSYIEDYTDSIEFEYNVYNENDNVEEYKNSFTLQNGLPTSIEDDSILKTQALKLKNTLTLTQLLKDVEKNPIINNLKTDKNVNSINEEVLEYLKIIDKINDLEAKQSSVSSEANSEDVFSWIKKGLDFQKDKNHCIWCLSKDNIKEIQRLRELQESKLINIKQALLAKYKQLSSDIEKISNNQSYRMIAKKFVSSLDSVKKYIDHIRTCINENKTLEIIAIEIVVDEIIVTQERTESNIVNYVLNKYLKDLLFYFKFIEESDSIIKSLTKNIKDENTKYAKKTEESLMLFIRELGLNKDVNIKLDNAAGNNRISLNVDGEGMKIFSEGQKHKLALAVFFSYLKQNHEKYRGIILDDPVISLDIFAYHSLRNILSDDSLVPWKLKRVILTHNVHYLFVQVSNLVDNIEKKDDFMICEISPNYIRTVDPQLMNVDDITLFTSYISETRSINSISLIYWMTLKIQRILLDLKLKIQSKSICQQPLDEIQSLRLEQCMIEELIAENRTIEKFAYKKTLKVEEIKKLFKSLNTTSNILLNDNIVPDNFFEYLETLDNDAVTIENPEALNIKEEILLFGRKIFYSDERKDRKISYMKNYIKHTRYQITDSLLAMKAKLDY